MSNMECLNTITILLHYHSSVCRTWISLRVLVGIGCSYVGLGRNTAIKVPPPHLIPISFVQAVSDRGHLDLRVCSLLPCSRGSKENTACLPWMESTHCSTIQFDITCSMHILQQTATWLSHLHGTETTLWYHFRFSSVQEVHRACYVKLSGDTVNTVFIYG